MADNDTEELYVWVSLYPDGTVGSVGGMMPGMGHTILASRSRAVAELMRPIARSHADKTGQRVWLRRFAKVEDLHDA